MPLPEGRVRRVDYDRVAADYDRRYRDGEPAGLAAFVRACVAEAHDRPVLEVGCGTGRWLVEADGAAARPIGVDPSVAMLERARRRVPSAHLIRARAEALPLAAGGCGAVLCVYVVHHLDDPLRAVAEATRVLAPGGTLSILALAPHDGSDRWYVYDHFDGTREADLERYPTTAGIAGWMTKAGLAHVQTSVAARITAEAAGSAVFDDPILTRHGTCQLSLLSDEAFEAGMERIRRGAAAATSATFTTDLRIFATVGVKSS
jgi:ubiquinone/menaquinone biosynthesis C-methylase UbiE